jgi:hypothetical protein
MAPPHSATQQHTVNESTRRYPRILAVYNKPEYDRMFLRDAATGRKIFVHPTFPGFDPAFTADIQSNGGRNDIVTVRSSWCTDLQIKHGT